MLAAMANITQTAYITMPKIFIGYGDHRGYRLDEIPSDLLLTLAKRYPLTLDGRASYPYNDLLVTVAIHAEVKRREAGGKEQPHVPSIRELAEEIVKKGFQQTSKSYHPDTQGHHGSQVLLTQARDLLKEKCKKFPDFDSEKDATIILSSSLEHLDVDDFGGMNISDDDIPF